MVQRLRITFQCRGHRFDLWSGNEDPTRFGTTKPPHQKWRRWWPNKEPNAATKIQHSQINKYFFRKKQGGWIHLQCLLSSIRQQVTCRNWEQNSCFPSPSPKLQPWVLPWPQSRWHSLHREDVQVQKSCERKSRKFTGCLRGRGYRKDQMGVYVVTVPVKTSPGGWLWSLKFGSSCHQEWHMLLMALLSGIYLILAKFSLCLSPTFPFVLPPSTSCTQSSLFPRWWWAGVEKATSFRVCCSGGPATLTIGTFTNSGSSSKKHLTVIQHQHEVLWGFWQFLSYRGGGTKKWKWIISCK